jgi:hypothetical protein
LIITCLWRSLYTLHSASVSQRQTRTCRVCPSIFSCQRPQGTRGNCQFLSDEK